MSYLLCVCVPDVMGAPDVGGASLTLLGESMDLHSSNSQSAYTSLDVPGASIKSANLSLFFEAEPSKFFPSFQSLLQSIPILVLFGGKEEQREANTIRRHPREGDEPVLMGLSGDSHAPVLCQALC